MDEGIPLRLLNLVADTAHLSRTNLGTDLLVILILIFVNGFFSASEMAVVTLNETKIRKQAETGDPKSVLLLRFIDHQSRFLATIQVGVTLAGFLSAAFGADRLAPVLTAWIDPTGHYPWAQTVATILITILVSFISLVLGELVPKRIGMAKAESFSKRFGTFLYVCEVIFLPFTRILNACADTISHWIGVDKKENENQATEDEIRLLTEVGGESGHIHQEEADMIQKVFELDDKEVSEIMTPRTAVLALPLDASYEEVMEAASKGRFSRIPVYEEDLDNIIGILHIKDLFQASLENHQTFDLKKYLRQPYFVPDTKPVNVLFRDMRQKRVTLAVAVDEYGGTDGIVTIEDVLEEIVGDITDEYDEVETPCLRLAEGVYSLDARLTPEEAGHFIPELDQLKEDDAYDTLAGFMLSRLERIPDKDEHPSIEVGQLKFTVTEMDERRIARLRVEKLPDVEANSVEE